VDTDKDDLFNTITANGILEISKQNSQNKFEDTQQ